MPLEAFLLLPIQRIPSYKRALKVQALPFTGLLGLCFVLLVTPKMLHTRPGDEPQHGGGPSRLATASSRHQPARPSPCRPLLARSPDPHLHQAFVAPHPWLVGESRMSKRPPLGQTAEL